MNSNTSARLAIFASAGSTKDNPLFIVVDRKPQHPRADVRVASYAGARFVLRAERDYSPKASAAEIVSGAEERQRKAARLWNRKRKAWAVSREDACDFYLNNPSR